MDNQDTENLTPEQKAQLAKQKKKDNELKKKQAAEEWKRQQALKQAGQPAEASKTDAPLTDAQSAQQGNKQSVEQKDKSTASQAAQPAKKEPEQKSAPAQKEDKQKQVQNANQSKTQRGQPQNQSKTNSLVSHLQPYEQLKFKTIREKYQNHPFASSLLHPALLEIALKFNNDLIIGSNRRCLSFLDALKKVISDFKSKEGEPFYKELTNCIDNIQNFLETFRAIPEGMKTAFKYIKNIVSYLVKSTISIEPQKKWINEQIDIFIKQKISNAHDNMIQSGLELIKNGDTILVYARSQVVENLFLTAHKKGKQFTVIVVDNPPFHEGKALLQTLSEAGIETIYTLLSNVPYFMKKASKIFVGASSMLTNGALVSRVGTALLACIARDNRTPFHVFCESYKFSEKSQLDSLSSNELAVKKSHECVEQQNNQSLHINLRYDLTPCEYVSMVVTEIGPVPPTSVHAIIREFISYGYVGKIELPCE